jgi:hypothetical protein
MLLFDFEKIGGGSFQILFFDGNFDVGFWKNFLDLT